MGVGRGSAPRRGGRCRSSARRTGVPSPNAASASREAASKAAHEPAGVVDPDHAPAAAARRRLEQHRVADPLGRRGGVLGRGDPVGALADRYADRRASARAPILSPPRRITSAGGPTNVSPPARTRRRARGARRGSRSRGARRRSRWRWRRRRSRRRRGSSPTRRGRPDAHHGVGAAGGEAVAVGVGHGGDRLDALVEARPHDPDGDLPAVGDEHAPQAHGAGSGWT